MDNWRQLGIVVHQHRSDVWTLAREAIAWCGDRVGAQLPHEDAELIGRPDLGVDDAGFGDGLDLCLSLGGDGTMLRSVELVGASGVPILGVNGGHLGYLTEIEPAQLIESLDSWLAGRLTEESRMMVEVFRVTESGDEEPLGRALNEAVILRAESGRAVELLTSIDGKAFHSYLADGLIVATPTGSTAYSLSAGGPIVEPDFEALIVTPVAAHMVFNRSMVLAPTTDVGLTVMGHRGAVLSLDGRSMLDLQPGDTVVCRAAKQPAKLLVSEQRDFHRVLKEKFHLVDRHDH